jgi:tRNA (cytidine/uridine-2'-O-)-methyltransferase
MGARFFITPALPVLPIASTLAAMNAAGLHVALLEPEIPPNTGNIVRSCAAVGAVLHLIEPLGFSLHDRYLKRAGLDYWPLLDLRVHANLAIFLDECAGLEIFYLTKKAGRHHTDPAYPVDVCFLLGRETLGLPDKLLEANRERCIRIPMKTDARSLNLSNAAAVVIYEYLRQRGFPGLA